MYYKKYLFLDAGNTLLHLKLPPGQVYYAVISEIMSLEQIPIAKQNSAFTFAWGQMPPGEGGRDRFSTHSGGEMGWWKELIHHYLSHLEIKTDSLMKDRLFHAIVERFDETTVWDFDKGIESLAEITRSSDMGLGLISNWDSRLRILLEKLGIYHYFDPILISAEFGYEKPSLIIFQEAARLVGLKNGLYYAGDKPELDYYPPLSIGWDAWIVGGGASGEKYVKNLSTLGDALKNHLKL